MQLHWHRRNLRTRSNPALSTAFAAAKRDDSRVVPLFVLDDAILKRADALGVAFMLGSLRELRGRYRDHGSDLVIRHGDPTDIVGRVAEALDVDRVVWNGDHSRLARERDRAVRRSLTRSGVPYASVPSERRPEASAATTPVDDPESYLADAATLGIDTEPVPRLSDLGAVAADSTPLSVGTESARKRLDALSRGTTYRRCDDDPPSVERRETSPAWV